MLKETNLILCAVESNDLETFTSIALLKRVFVAISSAHIIYERKTRLRVLLKLQKDKLPFYQL